ncbi:MAG: inner membrane-spanning protein YciB [Pseudomonadota bacterium]
MPERSEINPFVKAVLEFGPVLLFFVAYLRLKDEVYTIGGTEYDGFIVVTAAFIPLLVLTMGALWWLTGKLSRMQITTVVLVVVFGGLSVWLNDDRFIKMKPTIIYLLFGGLLAFGLIRGRSYLKFVMEEMMPLQDTGWMILTRRLMLMFFAMGLANEIVWRFFSTEAWVYFETFGLPAALFGFFMAQARLFQTFGLESEES